MSKEKANERINSTVVTTTHKKSPIIAVILIAVVVICVLAGVILHLLSGKDTKEYNQVIKPDNVEQVIAQLEEDDYTPVGSYEVKMNTEWTFPDGSSASPNAYVENSVTNQNTVYFKIVLDDASQKEIYKSPYLEVGSHLEDIQLDEVLEAGTYSAVLTYYLVDHEFNDISQVSISITLTIQN